MADYQAVNRANWDERVPAQAASPDYGVARFIADPEYLSEVVRFDLPRLGASMTGVDFSAPAVEQATNLAKQTGADAAFVVSDVYAAADAVGREAFDLVFTGVGALCWLPSITRWAEVVAGLLRPGGRLFIRDGHPMLDTMQDGRDDDLLAAEYPYFERAGPMVFDQGGTYVVTDVEFTSNVTHAWNHGLGEIVTALVDAGLGISGLTEHDSVPWEALPGLMEELPDGEWRLADRPWRLPRSFTLQARKRA